MKTKLLLPACGLLILAGCTEPEPIVSDFNGDSVKIVTSQFAKQDEIEAKALAEADRICKTRSRKAQYVSKRSYSNEYTDERLYLCL
jgi:hypothetical protein